MKKLTNGILKGTALIPVTMTFDLLAPITYPLAGAGLAVIGNGNTDKPEETPILPLVFGATLGFLYIPWAPFNLALRPIHTIGVSVAHEFLK